MTAIRFTVPGAPIPKGRPRFTVTGGKVRAYTPAKTAVYEKAVKVAAWNARSTRPLDGPLRLTAIFFVRMPKGKLRAYPTTRPDLTNYIKAVEDGMQLALFHDDAQIVELHASKRYGTVPRTEITVEQL